MYNGEDVVRFRSIGREGKEDDSIVTSESGDLGDVMVELRLLEDMVAVVGWIECLLRR